MKNEILSNMDNPAQLERLYRKDKPGFRRTFKDLYPELKHNPLAGFWNERLNFAGDEISWGSRNDLLFVIGAAVIAGFIAKLPAYTGIDEAFFYPRNVGFIVFPLLIAFFAWKNKLSAGKTLVLAVTTIAALVFINAHPGSTNSDTLILSCIHMILFLWSLLGFAFVGSARNHHEERLGYLKYNGDLVVMTTLILIAGGILTGVTIGLFELIGLRIEQFYFENIVVFGLPAAPLFGTYLTQTNPQLVGKVSPVIARIFSPLVLVMLVIYLGAIFYSGKDPYNDRQFLVIFNALLIGVMAIIFFSVAGTGAADKNRAETVILLLLSLVTIIVNGIALSAILFRISEWGFTPNRAAVLGGNALILVNLVVVAVQLVRVLVKKENITSVGKVIAYFLPLYCLWAAIVTFLFPIFFGFK
jgi:hypothetical protein